MITKTTTAMKINLTDGEANMLTGASIILRDLSIAINDDKMPIFQGLVDEAFSTINKILSGEVVEREN